jgi:uncharacterized OsmC-like protein
MRDADSGTTPPHDESVTDEAGAFAITLTLDAGYRFAATPSAPGAAPFHIDEGPPLGRGEDPSPVQVLAAAMASCLGSSLLFCLGKARVEVLALRVAARGTLVRNARRRVRVGSLHIELFPEVAPHDVERMKRCLEVFEDFCIVTESVRQGIPVIVGVQTHAS